jgi:hypothetical protein
MLKMMGSRGAAAAAYVVGVDLRHDLLDVPAVEEPLLPQGLLQLLHRDVPAVVLVEVLERGVEVLVPVHPVHVHRRRDELLVVYRPVPVGVGLRTPAQVNAIQVAGDAGIDSWRMQQVALFALLVAYSIHQLMDFGLAELGALLGQPSAELVHGYCAAVVGVHALEHLLETPDLLLRQASGDNLRGRGSHHDQWASSQIFRLAEKNTHP